MISMRNILAVAALLLPIGAALGTDAGTSDAFGSSTLKAFRPVHSSKLHHLFSRLSLVNLIIPKVVNLREARNLLRSYLSRVSQAMWRFGTAAGQSLEG